MIERLISTFKRKGGYKMKCALCRQEAELEESHVIPKFVFKSLKKHSPTGNMRMTNEPNKKVQDGDKMYLLCGSCEDLFNNDETMFAGSVYHKFQQGTLKEFEYGAWLERFIVSVNWRNLYLDIIEFVKEQNINAIELEYLIDCEKKLREFLLNDSQELKEVENHIFFFNEIDVASKVISEMNLHSALGSCVVGYTVLCDSYGSSYVFLNLQGLVMVTILKPSKLDSWKGTQVQKSGNFNLQEAQHITSPLMAEFEYIASNINSSRSQLSKVQREKILESIIKNQDKFLKSKAFKRLQNDKELRAKYEESRE